VNTRVEFAAFRINFVPHAERLFRNRELRNSARSIAELCFLEISAKATRLCDGKLAAKGVEPNSKVRGSTEWYSIHSRRFQGKAIMKFSPKQWIAFVSAITFSAFTAHAADLVWIGGTGNWNVAGNWSPAQIPTAADNAWITNSGTYAVSAPAGSTATANSLTLGGASGTQTFSIDRATVTVGPAASVVSSNGVLALTVAQSVVTGTGDITVNGFLNWLNGAITGTGALNIGSSGAMVIGSGGVTLSRGLNNSGASTWAGGNFTFSIGAALNNLAGGSFDIAADGRLNGSTGTPINNSGLFRQTAGTTGTIVNAPLNNSAMLEVLGSTLNLNLGGIDSGTVSNAAGAALNLGGGAHVFGATSFVTGPGSLTVGGTGTALAASGTFDSGSTLSVASGIVTLSPSCVLTGTTLSLTGNGAVVVYNSAGPVAVINLSAGALGGSSPVNVTGPLTLGGGTISNVVVTANGGLTISGNTTLNGTKLVNPSHALWSAGNVVGLNGAAISNLLGAIFINSFDGNMNVGTGATPVFINAGIFQKTNGTALAGSTSIDFQFFNTGTVEVQTNTLRYAFNQQTAGLTLLDGGALAAQAQPIQMSGGSLNGFGAITVANIQNVINASSLSPGLPLGELDIAGNYQQTASGILNIDLGGYSAGTNFDLITVSAGGAGGTATVGGTLNVALTNGFIPTNGATFTFLKAASRVGAFATFNYPSNDIGMQLITDATSATIKVTNLKPVVVNPIADPAATTYGVTFNFQFPANTFSDPDNDTLTYTAAGMPPGVTFSSVTRTFSGAPAQAGVFPVTVTATDSGAPSLSVTNTFNVTVTPAVLAITANPQTKIYGAADPVLTFGVAGLQLTDTPASVLSGVLTRAAGETVAGGPYAITQGTLLANSNYVISFTGSSLAITPAPLSVTADAKSKIYGASDPLFTASFSGFANGETPAVLGGTLSFARAPGEAVGNYSIAPAGLASGNYAITFNSGNLAITKAALSVTAVDATKIYGASDPAFSAVYSGFANGETATVLSGTLAFARASGENVGSYLITPSGLTSGNYDITSHTGTLTITKAPLSVTADAKSKVYGSADPSFTVSYSGFANSETSAVLGGTLSFTRASGENVGDYAITPSGLTSSNYAIAFHPGTLTISKATLSVNADAQTKIYGAADPALTYTVTGLQFTDTAASVLTGALARAAGENVAGSPYAIAQGTLAPNGNYTISFTGNSLAITRAPLSITADAKSKAYGAADPAFTVSYSGFVNGDTAAVLSGAPTFTRAPGENVGGYLITPDGLSSGNYNISFNTGTLSITKAALSITADAKAKTYGSIDPAFTASYNGFVNGETPAVLSGTLAFARVTGENAGVYAITPSGLTSGNYTITFNAGALTINPAPLSITADAKSKVYGAADPTFSVTYSGFVNSETPAVLGGGLSIARAVGESVGIYSLTPSGLTASNYAITFNAGNLAITKAPLQVTADSQTKIYGATDPALTFAANGLQFSDTSASVLSGALGRVAGESVAAGPYAITQGTLAADGNYTIHFTGNALTISRAPLSVTADAKTKVYGSADPAFTASFLGFVNGETAAVLGGTLSLARAPGENVGSYLITPTGLTSGNYAITFNTGNLVITKAPLSITADSVSKTFGTADPAFTASIAGLVNGDTSASLGGALGFTRAPGEGIGTYAITPSGVTSGNYTITFNNGALRIIAPAPSIFAPLVTKTNVVITWSAVSNATYRVQFKANLSDAWTSLAGDVLATGSTASKTDAPTTSTGFYRIQVLP
jgi:hypothetical protein